MRDPSDTDVRYLARLALLGFFLLTFAATWTAWPAPAATGTARFFGLGGPVFLLGIFAPAFVAIALTAAQCCVQGRASGVQANAACRRWPQVRIELDGLGGQTS